MGSLSGVRCRPRRLAVSGGRQGAGGGGGGGGTGGGETGDAPGETPAGGATGIC